MKWTKIESAYRQAIELAGLLKPRHFEGIPESKEDEDFITKSSNGALLIQLPECQGIIYSFEMKDHRVISCRANELLVINTGEEKTMVLDQLITNPIETKVSILFYLLLCRGVLTIPQLEQMVKDIEANSISGNRLEGYCRSLAASITNADPR